MAAFRRLRQPAPRQRVRPAARRPGGERHRRRFRGDRGVYGIIDQTLYREPGTEDEGASAFLRLSKVPGDRNLIDFYLDGGIAYKGLLPGRPNDTAALGVIYSRISPAARAFDRDTICSARHRTDPVE